MPDATNNEITQHLNKNNEDLTTSSKDALISSTGSIVASAIQRFNLQPDQLNSYITEVYNTLKGLYFEDPAKPVTTSQSEPQINEHTSPAQIAGQIPAVPIEDSVQDEYIVCLEDGACYKSMKRYLLAKYNLTPEQYRKKWGLPHDYPMISPAYARTRSKLAKDLDLGRKPGENLRGKRKSTAKTAAAKPAKKTVKAEKAAAVSDEAPKRRGRPPKVKPSEAATDTIRQEKQAAQQTSFDEDTFSLEKPPLEEGVGKRKERKRVRGKIGLKF